MRIKVKVKPNSKKELVLKVGDTYEVKLKEVPEKGKANQALVGALAKHFGVPRNGVKIVSGLKTRNKVISISTD